MRNKAREFPFRESAGALLALSFAVSLYGAPNAGLPVATPASFAPLQPTAVTVSCSMSSSDQESPVLPGGVNLLEVSSTDQSIRILAKMRDDGQQTDKASGDGIFTATVTLNIPTTGTFRVRCSGALRGVIERVLSPVLAIPVASAGPSEQPSISVSPTQGAPGQVIPSVLITGKNTSFSQGASTVTFGTGITVAKVTVSSATAMTVDLAIAGNAEPGGRPVTVTTGNQTVTLPNGFAVQVPPSPQISILSPSESSYLNASPVKVSGTVATGFDSVTVNGVKATISAGTFSASVPLEEGRNTITASVQTGNGGTATSSVQVFLDTVPPVVTITSPTQKSTLTNPQLTISGTSTDALSGLSGVACNGTAATITASNFSCSVTLSLGPNTINVTATDIAGNIATSALAVTLGPPVTISFTSPVNLSYLNLSPTTVSGTVTGAATSIVINGITTPVAGGSFSAQIPLLEGPNVLAATVGNTVTESITITLDTTPPRVTITNPPDKFITSEATISIAGSVNDIVVGTVNDQQAQVTVNGVPAQVANRTFLAASVPLNNGDNVIQVVGRDRSGNAATTQITVTRQPASGPRIRVISGSPQSGVIGSVLPSPLVVALTDAAGNPAPNKPVIFKVTQNDGMVVDAGAPAVTAIVNTNAQGQAQVQWTLGNRAGAGGNTVEVYSVGFNGTAIFTATGNQGTAGKIVIDSGNGQIGAIGQPLPKPLIAVVVDAGNNRLAGVPVTFKVIQGGGSFAGQSSFTVSSDSDGRVAASLTLGFQEGNANNLVEATFPGNLSFPAGFTASGRSAGDPLKTVISGVVLDNSSLPIPGVTIRAVLTNLLTSNSSIIQSVSAVPTNAQGQFTIPQAPVGFVKLLIDGSTAQLAGKYPTLDYDMVTVAGQTNNVGSPIFLLPLKQNNELCVTPSTGGGTLTIPEAPGFSLTFGPGQVTFPGGSKSGCVSVTVVHPDKVPMTPGFGQQPKFIVTIQPAGAIFNPPAPITLPNIDGLKPRRVTEMYSFDHDIGSFVAIGTGLVSDDGQVIRSTLGVGVLKAGWHCGGDPNAWGTVADCGVCNFCSGSNAQSAHCVQDDLQVPSQRATTDCLKQVCLNGSVSDVPDDSESPPQVSPNDCYRNICKAGKIDDVDDPTEMFVADPGAEFRVCALYPQKCLLVYGTNPPASSLQTRAFTWSNAQILAGTFGGVPPLSTAQFQCLRSGGAGDAGRHAYLSCLLSRLTGKDFAKLIGDAHERDTDGDDASCFDNSMDLFNNRVGRNLGDLVGTCEELTITAFQNGWLRVNRACP